MMLLTKTINGVEICYDESGYGDGPAIVLLTGWAHDLRVYDYLLPILAPKYRVIRLCWRGHGPSRDILPDFGVKEQADDALALLEELEVDQFALAAHSHGSWVALEIAQRVGKQRNVGILLMDIICTPPPPGFVADLEAMQSKSTWRVARKSLFDSWMANSGNDSLREHITYSLCGFGFEMWSLSCRVIRDAYDTWGTPLERMRQLTSPPPIRHCFSHPIGDAEYRKAHDDFANAHPWFSWTDLKGDTHFPVVEMPHDIAQQLEEVIKLSGTM